MHWTLAVFYVGILLFALGLVLAHVVLFASWSAKAKQPRPRRILRIAMGVAVAMFGVGLVLAAVGYFGAR